MCQTNVKFKFQRDPCSNKFNNKIQLRYTAYRRSSLKQQCNTLGQEAYLKNTKKGVIYIEKLFQSSVPQELAIRVLKAKLVRPCGTRIIPEEGRIKLNLSARNVLKSFVIFQMGLTVGRHRKFYYLMPEAFLALHQKQSSQTITELFKIDQEIERK